MSAESASTPFDPPGDAATSTLTIAAGTILAPGSDGRPVRRPGDLTIDGPRITAVGPSPLDPDGPSIDATGLLVAPGLVDLQINGGHGLDLWSDPDRLWDLARLLPRHGVTGFCPTIVSGPPDRAEAAIAAVGARPAHHLGAEPLGLHLEGPMLAPTRRGAHDGRHLIAPDPDLATRWATSGAVRLVTLAPELAGAIEVIEQLREAGITVSLGHTEATAADAARAERAGAGLVTHLFNAMAPLHHREPGLVGHTLGGAGLGGAGLGGAGLGGAGLAAGLIVDGIHVDPTVVALAARALGPDRLVLVSDAVAAMGLPPGEHRFGRHTVRSDEHGVRRPDGTLAGSNLSLDTAVRNLVAYTRCDPADAIAAATINPARAIGVDDHRGRLVAGAAADVILLDTELEVVATICGGRLAHLAPSGADRLSGVAAPPPAPG